MRKTIKVENLKERVNNMLLDLPDEDKRGREVLQNLIENVLLDSDNYNGFCYLNQKDMKLSENGTSFGITEDRTFEGTDETRVRYF